MESYRNTKNIGVRVVYATRDEGYEMEKNFMGLNRRPTGTDTWRYTGFHKGWEILAYGKVIGYSDSLENIDALLKWEAHARGLSNTGSRQIITPRGGLVITCPNAKKSISKKVRDSFEPTSRDYSKLAKIQPSTKLPENWKSMSTKAKKAWHAANKGGLR